MDYGRLISEHDFEIIYDLARLHYGRQGKFFIERMHYIFGSDFSINHCLVLGQVIGRLEGAEKTLEDLQTNLNSCVQN